MNRVEHLDAVKEAFEKMTDTPEYKKLAEAVKQGTQSKAYIDATKDLENTEAFKNWKSKYDALDEYAKNNKGESSE